MIGSNKPPPPPEEDESDSWIVTFADMTTLLLAFFVILVSISKVDVVLFEKVKSGIQEGIGNRTVAQPIQQLRAEAGEVIKSLKVEDDVGLGQDQDGLVITFASGAFYKPGSAELLPKAIPVLEKIIGTLNEPRYQNFQIEVQGHTDDTPIHTEQFPSNWELSAERATRVVRLMQSDGVDKDRLLAIAYADVAPKAANRGPEGKPLPLNQAQNRRIVVRVYPRNTY